MPRSGVLARLTLGVVAALVLAGQPQPAAAATGPIPLPKTTSAIASSFHQDQPEGAAVRTDTLLQLVNVDGVATACLNVSTYAPTPEYQQISFGYGCADLRASGYSIAKSLSGASLSAVTITIDEYFCSSWDSCIVVSRPVTVPTTTWTGVGVTNSFKNKSKATFEGCTINATGSGSYRQASVVVNGVAAPGDIAFIATSTGRIKVSCV